MQKITILVTTSNSRKKTFNLEVDETIGLNAGRDLYSTARGTTMKIMRQLNMFSWANARLWVDNKIIDIWIENKKFVHTMTEVQE